MSSAWADDPDAWRADASAAYRSDYTWPGNRDTWIAGRCASESDASDWWPPCRRIGSATWCPDRVTVWTCCGTTWCDVNCDPWPTVCRRHRRLLIPLPALHCSHHGQGACPPRCCCVRCPRRVYSAADGIRSSVPQSGACRTLAAAARPTTSSRAVSRDDDEPRRLRSENEKEKNRHTTARRAGRKSAQRNRSYFFLRLFLFFFWIWILVW